MSYTIKKSKEFTENHKMDDEYKIVEDEYKTFGNLFDLSKYDENKDNKLLIKYKIVPININELKDENIIDYLIKNNIIEISLLELKNIFQTQYHMRELKIQTIISMLNIIQTISHFEIFLPNYIHLKYNDRTSNILEVYIQNYEKEQKNMILNLKKDKLNKIEPIEKKQLNKIGFNSKKTLIENTIFIFDGFIEKTKLLINDDIEFQKIIGTFKSVNDTMKNFSFEEQLNNIEDNKNKLKFIITFLESESFIFYLLILSYNSIERAYKEHITYNEFHNVLCDHTAIYTMYENLNEIAYSFYKDWYGIDKKTFFNQIGGELSNTETNGEEIDYNNMFNPFLDVFITLFENPITNKKDFFTKIKAYLENWENNIKVLKEIIQEQDKNKYDSQLVDKLINNVCHNINHLILFIEAQERKIQKTQGGKLTKKCKTNCKCKKCVKTKYYIDKDDKKYDKKLYQINDIMYVKLKGKNIELKEYKKLIKKEKKEKTRKI